MGLFSKKQERKVLELKDFPNLLSTHLDDVNEFILIICFTGKTGAKCFLMIANYDFKVANV